MNSRHILTISIVFILLFSCERESVNSNENTMPNTITYQLYDTVTNDYVTYVKYQLFPDSAGIYFDSVRVFDPSYAQYFDYLTYTYDYSRYSSQKYIVSNNIYNPIDSMCAPIIHFDNYGRITELFDCYDITNLSSNPSSSSGGGDYFEFYLEYNNFINGNTSLTYASANATSPDARSYLMDMNVKSLTLDSMQVESGFNPHTSEKLRKYSVQFDSRQNNTNIMMLSGIGILDGPLFFSNTNKTFGLTKMLPLPKINMPLAKSIIITYDYFNTATPVKIVDFFYIFDDENRVTRVDIQSYNFDGLTMNNDKMRILLSY